MQSLLQLAVLATMATANVIKSPSHAWSPPKHGDVRSPCPGLNVLANHAYLPHSGHSISYPAIQSATGAAFNWAPDVFASAFQMVVDFNLSTTGDPSTFNLIDLKKHDAIEFDGSLSRNDFYSGNDNDFDPKVFHSTAKTLGLYDEGCEGEGKEAYLTVEVAARAAALRVVDAKKVNPTFNASALQMMGNPGTTSLYLTTLWDDEKGAAPKAWVRDFFVGEKISDSFKKQKAVKTTDDLVNRTKAVIVAMKAQGF